MYLLKFLITLLVSEIDVSLQVNYKFHRTLERSISKTSLKVSKDLRKMYLLKFFISFLGPYVDVSLQVLYKFPWNLDRDIS